MQTRAIAFAVTVFAGASAGLAQGPVVTDVKKTCQLTLPADWAVEGSTGYSPGKKISATVNGAVSTRTFEAAKTFVKTAYKPVMVIQDDPKRLLYAFDPGIMGAGKSGWYEVVATTPTCAASFMFAPGSDESLTVMKKIVDSLAPVGPRK